MFCRPHCRSRPHVTSPARMDRLPSTLIYAGVGAEADAVKLTHVKAQQKRKKKRCFSSIQFADLYREDHFINSLKDEVDMVKELHLLFRSMDLEGIGSLIEYLHLDNLSFGDVK